MLTTRQDYIVSRPSVSAHPSFVHTPAAGKPARPDYTEAILFTADPVTNILSSAGKTLAAGRRVRVNSTGTLPAGLAAGTDYFVLVDGLTSYAFKVSATPGGTEIDITDAGTGPHSWFRYLQGPGAPVVFTADPDTDLLAALGHGMAAGRRLRVTTTDILPLPLLSGRDYFVLAAGLATNAFQLSTYAGGPEVDLTDAGLGVHSYLPVSEQEEVDAYLDSWNGSGPHYPGATLPAALDMIAELELYLATPAYQTWWMDDQLTREAQYLTRRADLILASEDTVPVSGTSTGDGTGAVASPVPAQHP